MVETYPRGFPCRSSRRIPVFVVEAINNSPSTLGIAKGHVGRGLLVARMHHADFFLTVVKRVENVIELKSGQPKDGFQRPEILLNRREFRRRSLRSEFP